MCSQDTAIPEQHTQGWNSNSSLTSQLLGASAVIDVEGVVVLLHALALALGYPLCNGLGEEVHELGDTGALEEAEGGEVGGGGEDSGRFGGWGEDD